MTSQQSHEAQQHEAQQQEAPSSRTSPLHAAHVAAGASFTDFAGWQMPVRYSSDLAEHHAVRTAAGLFDLSHMGEIVVLGPEAGQALDYALAGKLSSVAVDQAKYSLLLSRTGGIVDDLVVYRTGDDRYMVVANASNRDAVAQELRDRTAPFDVEVFDESDDIALIAVQGPAALSILLATPGLAADDGALDGEDFGERLSALKYYRSLPAEFQTRPALIARTGYTGEDGFELLIPNAQAGALWDALLAAGEPHGLVPAGLAARDTLRLEAGMPLYGHELGRDIAPAQSGLERVVATTKDEFVGKAGLEARDLGGARVLVGLSAEGRRAGRAGYRVLGPDGAEVGEITSGALSPTLGHPIALAFVAPEFAAPGTALSIDVRGTGIPATVTTLPFYRRTK